MKKIKLSLSQNSEVRIGKGILEKASIGLSQKGKTKKAFIIYDKKAEKSYKKVLSHLEKKKWQVFAVPIVVNEKWKSFNKVLPLYGKMMESKLDRFSTLFAIGGGVIGDLGGFLASTYMRGIDWVNIPTTLLAQVDSSLGGKTAVNHPKGKNLIGTFWQPSLVLCDPEALRTLPKREIISGLGESLKYGLAFDKKFFFLIQDNWDELVQKNLQKLSKIVYKSLYYKSLVVKKDERDILGIRETLNFGHTFAHSLEKITEYGTFRHGEAVIWGMKAALILSFQKKMIKEKEMIFVYSFLDDLKLPSLKGVTQKKLIDAMDLDKKKRQGKLRFILLEKIGKTRITNKITKDDLKKTFSAMGIK